MSWIVNKIVGDLAESVCTSHFKAIGYDVQATGVENSMPFFAKSIKNTKLDKRTIISKKIYNQYRGTPDLLISRIDSDDMLVSYFVEVKYRETMPDLSKFKVELYWQYRHIIYSDLVLIFLDDNNVKHWLQNKKDDDKLDIKTKENILNIIDTAIEQNTLRKSIKEVKDFIKNESEKNRLRFLKHYLNQLNSLLNFSTKTEVIFYLIVKDNPSSYVLINYTGSTDQSFKEICQLTLQGRRSMYKSTIGNDNFMDIYNNTIKIALSKIFKLKNQPTNSPYKTFK